MTEQPFIRNCSNAPKRKSPTTSRRISFGQPGSERPWCAEKASRSRRPKCHWTFSQLAIPGLNIRWTETGPSFGNTAIVAQTHLGAIGNPPPHILNQALHGQATTAVLSYENQETMISVLTDPDQWLNQQTNLPDAILLSAGGDDLVGDQFAIYLDYGGAGGLNVDRFEKALDSVEASYLDLFAFRDLFAKGVPVIAHCYDYALPNNVHPICVQHGWLQPSIDFAGYEYQQGLSIVQQMIDMFHDRLTKLATAAENNFAYSGYPRQR